MATDQLSRVTASVPVTLHFGGQDAEVDHQQFQISPRGMVFCSKTVIPAWTEVSIAMHLPSGNGRPPEEVECHGVVINSRRQRGGGCKCAVLFLDLSKKAEARLVKICPPSQDEISPSNVRSSSPRSSTAQLVSV